MNFFTFFFINSERLWKHVFYSMILIFFDRSFVKVRTKLKRRHWLHSLIMQIYEVFWDDIWIQNIEQKNSKLKTKDTKTQKTKTQKDGNLVLPKDYVENTDLKIIHKIQFCSPFKLSWSMWTFLGERLLTIWKPK